MFESTNYKKHTSKRFTQRFLVANFYKSLINLIKPLSSETILSMQRLPTLTATAKTRVFLPKSRIRDFQGNKPGISKFGWEGTTVGYTGVVTPQSDGSYKTQFIDFHSGIALDVGKLSE